MTIMTAASTTRTPITPPESGRPSRSRLRPQAPEAGRRCEHCQGHGRRPVEEESEVVAAAIPGSDRAVPARHGHKIGAVSGQLRQS